MKLNTRCFKERYIIISPDLFVELSIQQWSLRYSLVAFQLAGCVRGVHKETFQLDDGRE